MICSHCPNSNYAKTGVPSCFLPHCKKTREQLGRRYAELAIRHKSDDEWAEYWMIQKELGLSGRNGNAKR